MAIQTWSRRRFLRTAGIAGLAPLIAPGLASGADDWSREFAGALEADPTLLGWRGIATDQVECTARIEGHLPPELQGTLFRNGPAVHERFGLRYRHLFDGDGMVQAFRFDGQGVTHRARVLATPKLVRETRAGTPTRLGIREPRWTTQGKFLRASPMTVNVANISMLDHHGELLALWEGGSASVIDRDTLEWRRFKVWSKSLERRALSPHTRRWSPTEPCGHSGSASLRARCPPALSHQRRRRRGQSARHSTPARSAWCTTSWSLRAAPRHRHSADSCSSLPGCRRV